jgi:hypothetical protein
MIKNPQANAILECMYQVFAQMLRTAELNMAKLATPNASLTTWHGPFALPTTHPLLKASPSMAIFGHNMLFGITFIANWNKVGDYRQHRTNLNMDHKNSMLIEYDTKLAIWFW